MLTWFKFFKGIICNQCWCLQSFQQQKYITITTVLPSHNSIRKKKANCAKMFPRVTYFLSQYIFQFCKCLESANLIRQTELDRINTFFVVHFLHQYFSSSPVILNFPQIVSIFFCFITKHPAAAGACSFLFLWKNKKQI